MVGSVEGLLTSVVVNVAMDKLSSLVFKSVTEQVGLVWNFRKDLKNMNDTMESIAAVLMDAEKQSIRNESVRLWLKRLKHAALDISDMMDNAKIPFLKRKAFAEKMKKMREKLEKINKEHQDFSLSPTTYASPEQQHDDHKRETTSAVNEAKILGRDEEKKQIVDILSASHRKDGARILPIYGLGGLGKSTLARLVYNDTQLKQYEHRAWVYVSQKFDLKEIGSSIISLLSKYEDQQNFKTLEIIEQRLNDLLHDKRILIVLDDIWEENVSKLEELKSMLHVGKKDSMVDIIVTTRKESIAKRICTDEPHKLQHLEDDVCWEIIKRSSGFEHKSNKGLEQIGLDIAKKCGGLPLAAQAIGYTLGSKDLHGWTEVNNSDIWNESFGDDNLEHEGVLPSLMLSYEQMSPMLRLCFSYCAIFQKGRHIYEDDLIHQWLALDYIKKPSDGKKYIKQLLGMSFLQHSKLRPSDKLAYFRIKHLKNILHQLGLPKQGTKQHLVDRVLASLSDDQGQRHHGWGRKNVLTREAVAKIVDDTYSGSDFSHFRPKEEANDNVICLCNSRMLTDNVIKFDEGPRPTIRYTMHDLVHDLATSIIGDELIVIDASKDKGNNTSKHKYCRFAVLTNYDGETKLSNILPRKLRALHFTSSSRLQPCDDGSLSFARCLRILDFRECSSAIFLPPSIAQLHQLRCLITPKLQNDSLPESIDAQLSKLQCLNLERSDKIAALPESIGNLSGLIYLCLHDCYKILLIPESLGALESLVHLDMSSCVGITALPESLVGLKSLVHLNIKCCSRITGLPESLGGLKRLVYLNISYCTRMTELPKSLGGLENLVYLIIKCCYEITILPESLDGLKSLEHLDISGCSRITALPESIGELKSLVHLDMHCCRTIAVLPESLFHLTNLQHLDLDHCIGVKELPNSFGGLSQLQYLSICPNVTSLPDSIRQLTSLQTLTMKECENILTLEWMGGFSSLRYLKIYACEGINSLPPSVEQFTKFEKLKISYNPELKRWCDLNKKKLAHVKEIEFYGCDY